MDNIEAVKKILKGYRWDMFGAELIEKSSVAEDICQLFEPKPNSVVTRSGKKLIEQVAKEQGLDVEIESKETDAIKCHIETLYSEANIHRGLDPYHPVLVYEDTKPSDKFVVVYGKSGKTKYRKLSDEEVSLYEANPDEVERALVTQLEGEEGI